MHLQTAIRTAASKSHLGITFINSSDSETWMSYKDVYSSSLRILSDLRFRGVLPGNEVVIQVEDNKTLICVFWACVLGKMIPVPLSKGSGQDQKLLKILDVLSFPFIVADECQIEKLTERTILNSELMVSAGEAEIETACGSDLAYIQFSSGSTGEPKGVCLTHDNLISNARDIIKSLQITEADILLNWMPLTHDMGMIGFHITGVVGLVSTLCMPVSAFIRKPLLWMDKAASHRATVLYSPTFGLRYFLSALTRNQKAKWDLSCVRIIVNGAEMISEDICCQFMDRMQEYQLSSTSIVAAYGLAEASVEVSAVPPGSGLKSYFLHRNCLNVGDTIRLVDKGCEQGVRFVDVGYAVSSCEVRICDIDDNPLAENIVGHLQIRGRNVTGGYYNNKQATRSVFTRDNWLKTGDIGFVREGRLTITGRSKNMIIINGQNYYPHDIEHLLIGDGLAETGKVVVCGTGNYEKAEELIVFILYKGSWDTFLPVADSIRDTIAKRLAISVSQVIPVRKIPKTTSGKIKYFSLTEQYLRGDFNEWAIFYKNSTVTAEGGHYDRKRMEQEILRAVRTLMDQKEIGPDTSLFEAGLNSMSAAQLIALIYNISGVQLSFQRIFEHCTVHSLIECLSGQQNLRSFLSPPSFSQQRFGLSAAQQRIWLECHLNRNSTAYNIPVVYNISGRPDILSLERAIRCLIRKYEILRTSFHAAANSVEQRVHEYADDLFAVKHIEIPEGGASLDQVCERESNKVFDLEYPSQLQVSLISWKEDEHLLAFVIHHIIADGWSLRLLFEELSRNYNSIEENPDAANGYLPQYSWYVAWQQEFIRSDLYLAQKTYWRIELKDAPPVVTLPTLSALAVGRNEGGLHAPLRRYTHSFGEKYLEAIKILAARMSCTPFGIIMSLINVLLYRYTGAKDIITGLDCSGRLTAEMEKVIGYQLNTLFLRIPIDGDETFGDVVRTVRGKMALALDNQFYPFEAIVKDTDLDAHFSVFVVYQSGELNADGLELRNCNCVRRNFYPRDGFFDLQIEFFESAADLRAEIGFNDSVYAVEVVRRFADHLAELAYSVLSDNTKTIGNHSFFAPDELEVILPGHNMHIQGSATEVPVQVQFERSAAANPYAVAVIAGEREYTYKELNNRANYIAYLLNQQSTITPGDRIGFITARNENIVLSVLGILKAGGAYVAIDPEMPVQRIRHIVSDSNLRNLLFDRDLPEALTERVGDGFLLNIDQDYSADSIYDNPVYKGSMTDLAYVNYTSGSTGYPKGIMIEHLSLSRYVRQFINYFSVSKDDGFLQQASVSFDTMVEEIFPALCTSGRVVISPDGARDISAVINLIRKNMITVLSTTPSVLNALNLRVDSRMASLRLIISGGDVLHPSDIDILFKNFAVYNSYGPTEATVCATYKKVESIEDVSFIGRPIDGCHVYILSSRLELMPMGCVGEICIEGSLARGYVNMPEQTSSRFVQHPFEGGKRLFRSGDRGRYTDSGDLQFMGRVDCQVKVRGHRVELEEVERVIREYPGVRKAAVSLIEAAGSLVAYLAVDGNFSEKRLRLMMADYLPYYMIPNRFEVVEELPLTRSGKIDRQLLRSDEFLSRLPKVHEAGLRSPSRMEEWLMTKWKEILNVPEISVTDDFFFLGGDSMKANQLVNSIYDHTAIKVELPEIFVHSTIVLLGELIDLREGELYHLIEI